MIEDAPTRIEEREWDRGLWWMVVASGALHAVLIVIALVAPWSFIEHRPAAVSYTVDLIAPDRVGGSNAVAGGKGRTTGPPLVAAAPAVELPAAAAPPAPKVEAPKPAPPVEVKLPEPQPKAPKVEAIPPPVAVKPPPPAPPKVEEPKPQVKPQEPEPKPKVAEVKPEPKPEPKPNDMVLKDKAKKPEPAPSPATKPAASPPAVAKAEAPKAPSPKVAAPAKAPGPVPAASPATGPAKPAEAKKAEAKPGAGDLDTRIAAAVKRVEQQTGVRGGGLGSKPGEAPGGPIAVGPGEGVGGAVMGFEYLMYLNQLQARLKENWAWAGVDRNRKAVVRFSIRETGEVADVRITETSGDSSYDASVERAVRAANPLPPPPEAYRKQFSDVEYTFTPESMEM